MKEDGGYWVAWSGLHWTGAESLMPMVPYGLCATYTPEETQLCHVEEDLVVPLYGAGGAVTFREVRFSGFIYSSVISNERSS